MAEKPTAAFVLSLIGGIFILLGGILTAVVLAAIGGILGGLGFTFMGLGLEMMGILGVVLSLILIIAAVMMYVKPQQHAIWGALVLVMAIISFPFTAFGGVIIGFILALVGSILGIVFKPSPPMVAPYGAPPMAPPPQ